jgi:16S rRNA (adenine1518-N6/adenine1519-N6)-dimethyltransferase
LQETGRPKKFLGQHFLADDRYCLRIVRLAQIVRSDAVIEIGPGTGQLTQHLLTQSSRLLALEIDPDMIRHLKSRFAGEITEGRLSILQADILDQDWSQISRLQGPSEPSLSAAGTTLKVIGNLPYNIATRIIQRTTAWASGFQLLVFMTQKEVAQRILAEPGTGDYGFLTVWLSFFYEARKGFDVPPGAFVPRPKVYSHVFSLVPKEPPQDPVDTRKLYRLLTMAFGHRRKTLWNNLAPAALNRSDLESVFERLGLDRRVRPEEVELEQFLCMTRVLSFAQ